MTFYLKVEEWWLGITGICPTSKVVLRPIMHWNRLQLGLRPRPRWQTYCRLGRVQTPSRLDLTRSPCFVPLNVGTWIWTVRGTAVQWCRTPPCCSSLSGVRWWLRLQKTYSKPTDMIPSQSFGGGGGGGAENGRRPGEGQTVDKGQGRQAASERSMRVSHIDVTLLNSSPTASCELCQRIARDVTNVTKWRHYCISQSQPPATTAYASATGTLPSCGRHGRNYWN